MATRVYAKPGSKRPSKLDAVIIPYHLFDYTEQYSSNFVHHSLNMNKCLLYITVCVWLSRRAIAFRRAFQLIHFDPNPGLRWCVIKKSFKQTIIIVIFVWVIQTTLTLGSVIRSWKRPLWKNSTDQLEIWNYYLRLKHWEWVWTSRILEEWYTPEHQAR